MSARDVADRTERLRVALGRLGCSRAEALALAVLACGACGALVVVWALARPGEPLALAGEPSSATAHPTVDGADAHGHGSGDALATPGVRGEAPPAESGGADAGVSGPTTAARLVVHVSGLVGAPGVYDLAAGSRVADAIHAAGGLLPGARPDGLNLARPLADGEQLHVPGAHEVAAGAGAGGPAPGSGAGEAGSGGAAGAEPPGDGRTSEAWLPDGRLDINRASQADFEALPGIGPVLAERIVSHRDEVGRFESIGDLLAVRGIGEKTLAALADLIVA